MRGNPRGRGAIALMLLALVLSLGIIVTKTFSRPTGPPVRVVVPERSTFRAAADSLARARIVTRPRLFRIYARMTGNDRDLKPGTYLFRRNTPWRDVLSALTGGKGLVRPVIVPEGYSLAQISALLARALDLPGDSVSAAARDTTLLHRLGVPAPTLEGYLFPATYAFPEGTTARRAVAEMVRRFEREWQGEWDARLGIVGLDRHQVVTLASIVEGEARVPAERPVIAAVYYNRLRVGMALQADPTIQYARGARTPRLTYRDLEIDSPYNTYRFPGLPPGPIGSPGAASLRATLFPATTQFLYFAAYPDGHHEFSRTLEDHTRVVDRTRPLWDTYRRAYPAATVPPVVPAPARGTQRTPPRRTPAR